MSSIRHHTTQSHPAFEARSQGIGRGWLLITAGLMLTAVVSLSLRSVCVSEVAGANETGFGVRHEQRGTGWVHCEPWIRRVLGN